MRPAYKYRASLVRVIDGDTIVVNIDLGLGVWVCNQYLRLYGIDTPELRGQEREAGLRARQFVCHALKCSEIVIETHKGDSKGKYGRWLATVWYKPVLTDKFTNLNSALVDDGQARKIEG